jgi:hypothetical protein
MVPSLSYIGPLLVEIFNLFINSDPESLLVPTFRSIIINPKTNEVSLNVFSFTGLELFFKGGSIDASRVMEIVAFFPSKGQSSKVNRVSLQRALAVILLGLLIGK